MTLIHVDPWTSTLPESDGERIVTLSGLVERLEALRGTPVLLLAGPGEAEHIARLARNLVGQSEVGVLVLSRFPTSRWLMGALLGMLPPGDFRHAVALVEYARHFIVTRALVSSVTRVEAPTPRLVQHARSWFPGAWFDIDVTGGSVVSRKPADWQLEPAPVQVLTGSTRWQERFSEVPGAEQGIALEGPVDDAQWHARNWVEVSSLQHAANQVVSHVLGEHYVNSCRECARSTRNGLCAFCGSFVKDDHVPIESSNGVIPV